MNFHTTAFPSQSASNPGLTKREYFAAAALQGLLANPDAVSKLDTIEGAPTWITLQAVELADSIVEDLATTSTS